MALVIYDQGYRIQTPISSLLTPKGVEQLEEIKRSRSIPSSEDIPLSPREQPSHAQSRRAQQAFQDYQSADVLQRRISDRLNVDRVMTTPVVTIRTGTKTLEAGDLFRQHSFKHLAVINETGLLMGILTERDLLSRTAYSEMLSGPTRNDLNIEGVYATKLIVATPDTEVSQIARTFIEHKIGCIPILDEDGTLVGIVTQSDLLPLIASSVHMEGWA